MAPLNMNKLIYTKATMYLLVNVHYRFSLVLSSLMILKVANVLLLIIPHTNILRHLSSP